jgi:hypothetical protein
MQQQEGSGQWPKLSGQVLDKVTGRDMSLTCNFNIKIDLQKQLAQMVRTLIERIRMLTEE